MTRSNMYKITVLFALLTGLTLNSDCQVADKKHSTHHPLPPASNPMSCNIRGKIIYIYKPGGTDRSSPCSKYPCKARVKILACGGCGPSAAPPAPGTVLDIDFAFTLHATAKLFPGAKAQYPGLKKGNEFTAIAELRLKPYPANSEYIVYAYELN